MNRTSGSAASICMKAVDGSAPWYRRGRKYIVIYRSVVMENIQYVVNIAMGFLSYFIINFVMINLWDYMYGTSGEAIAGYGKEQMIWYVMITEMIWFGARGATVARQVSTDIRNGNIVYMVNKPYYYPFYVMAKYTGEWSVQLPMYAGLAVVMGMAMVGRLPGFRAAALLAVILCVILGITINAGFKLCISLLSFWIEDAHPFQWLYDKLILVIGVIFPIEIFPEKLQPFFRLTPIYTVCYGPAKLVVDFSGEKCMEILCAQLLYVLAGGILIYLVYRKGVKKLYVNGG